MKKTTLPILLGLALPFAGCVVTSVSPFYTAADLVVEPALPGRWWPADEQAAGTSFIEFRPCGDKAYWLAVEENQVVTNKCVVHLFKLKGQLFMDLLPTGCHDDFIPTHQVLKATISGASLKLAGLKYKWLEETLARNPGAIRHEKIKEQCESNRDTERIVLTAATKELQEFVLKNLENKEAWDEPGELKRRP
jgi:hypothetical protein